VAGQRQLLCTKQAPKISPWHKRCPRVMRGWKSLLTLRPHVLRIVALHSHFLSAIQVRLLSQRRAFRHNVAILGQLAVEFLSHFCFRTALGLENTVGLAQLRESGCTRRSVSRAPAEASGWRRGLVATGRRRNAPICWLPPLQPLHTAWQRCMRLTSPRIESALFCHLFEGQQRAAEMAERRHWQPQTAYKCVADAKGDLLKRQWKPPHL